MTNELLKEMTDKLIYGDKSVAPYGIMAYACGCNETSHPPGLCNCMIPIFEDDEVIEQCDLGDTTCEACQ